METSFFAHETAIIDDGAVIGAGTRIWHFSHIMGGVQIGQECSIGQNVFIASGVTLGDRTKVQNNVSIYTGVTTEADVFLGPSCVFTNVWNPRAHIQRKDEFRATHLGRGVTIGANATIVCGHTIGEYAFVGAGAVVTKDIRPYELLVGNPARVVGWMSRSGARLQFKHQEAICPLSGEVYLVEDGIVFLKEN